MSRTPCFLAVLLTSASLLALPVADAQAQRLGRLFMSPADRAALDEMRQQAGLPAPPPEAAPDPEPEPEPEGPLAAPPGPGVSTLVINGVVRRSSGPSSVWVNGDLLERGGVSREGVGVESARDAAGSVRLRLPSGAGTVALRPGQQIDIDSGTLLEAYDRHGANGGESAFLPRAPSPLPAPGALPAPGDSAVPPASGSADPGSGASTGSAASAATLDAAQRARILESLADPDTARSPEERAAIESLRRGVQEALAGGQPSKP